MEEVPGIAGAVPPLPLYPDTKTRSSLPSQEWQACLDLWLLSVDFRLRLQDEQFTKLSAAQPVSGAAYLASYINNCPTSSSATMSAKESQLHRRNYFLLKRLLLLSKLLQHVDAKATSDYTVDGSVVFRDVADWSTVLATLAQEYPKLFNAGLDHWKTSTAKSLGTSQTPEVLQRLLGGINVLVKAYSQAGVSLMTGSDFLESLADAYRHHAGPEGDQEAGRTLTEHLYHCLRSLMSDKTRHPSLLLDHLYQLRSEADQLGMKKTETKTLLASLLCTTSFLRHLAGDAAIVDSKRGADMLDALLVYREQTRQLYPPPLPRKKANKGKARANEKEELHMHQAAQVSQIHELFPDLPSGYILRLFDHFSNDVEQVTAALLEPSSLPSHLQDPHPAAEAPLPPPDLAPRTTPPPIPQRKNVFDNDDFDRLRISSKNIHRGRREIKIHEPETAEEHNRSKAATLAALARFDSDDDERDDTYDAADVGGSLDVTVDTDTRPRAERAQEQNPHEEVLYRAWKDNATLYARDSQTRISKVRQDLKRQTGMSDEQIEGWAIMLSRDAALQRRLQQKYSAVGSFQGSQRVLEQTRWQATTSGENSMDEGEGQSSDTGTERGRGGANVSRGRGRGGPAFVASTGGAPQGGRGRGRGRGGGRANHGRREGRARKMGRGMAGAPAA